MKLWKVTRPIESGWYDVYDGCVVAADTAKDALTIHPDGIAPEEMDEQDDTWDASRATAELIGTAIRGTKRGVVIASFRAA